MSNNRAERSIKPFVISRKNFLFANTPKGATGSAVMFSLIQTAIENGLEPYKYLTWLMKMAKDADLEDATTVQALYPGMLQRNAGHIRERGSERMKLKKHGAFLVNFVIDFANGDMSRWEFDLDYSGYVIEHFPEFQREHLRLSRKFADTIEHTYSACSWMPDDRFRDAISDAVDEFLGTAPKVDIS